MLFIYRKLQNIFVKNKIKFEKNLSHKFLKPINKTSNFFSQNAYLFFFH
jgi:hypothetical protein